MKINILAAALLLLSVSAHADELLSEEDFVYLGAFQTYTSQSNMDSYSGTALAYNATSNTLFISGSQSQDDGYVAEISIPTAGTQTSKSSLPYATYQQGPSTGGSGNTNFWDIAGGNLYNNASGGAACSDDVYDFGGLIVYNSELMGSATVAYQGSCTYLSYFFTGDTTLSDCVYDGYYGVNPTNASGWHPRMTNGSIAVVPTAYQTQLGGKMVSTAATQSVMAATGSYGPALVVFDPDALGTKNTASDASRGSATWLIGYPDGHKTLGTEYEVTDYYSRSDHPRAVIIPAGTRTLAFIGVHGTGEPCYGAVPPCYDPADGSEGVHNYPYVDYMWLYDIGNSDGSNTTGNTTPENGYTTGTMHNTLTAVKLGLIDPWDVIPYEVFEPTGSPFDTSVAAGGGGWGSWRAAAMDTANNKIYITRNWGVAGPIIEVYSVIISQHSISGSISGSFSMQ